MELLRKYKRGQRKEAIDEAMLLDRDAFNTGKFLEIDALLTEVFERVAYNVQIIYNSLKHLDYKFYAENKSYGFQVLDRPNKDTEDIICQISQKISHAGFLPLSFQYFYKIVGGVDFVWDYENYPTLMWEMADPLHVPHPKNILQEVESYWLDVYAEYPTEDNLCIYFSPDDLHKDNVSGGTPYAIQLTKEKSIDAKVLNEASNTNFINYLRICFEYGGFPGMEVQENPESYSRYLEAIKPKLKPI